MNFYSIYDSQLNRLVSPFLASSDLAAQSMVRDSLESHSIISQFPGNFELVCVGSWDEVYGIVGTERRFVCAVSSLILQKEGANAYVD